MEHALQSRPRIEVVDALRGFAVMAIILLHNIEHFNLYNFPEATTDFMKALDKGYGIPCSSSFPGRHTLFSPCCSVLVFSSSLITKRGKGRTSGFVSSGG